MESAYDCATDIWCVINVYFLYKMVLAISLNFNVTLVLLKCLLLFFIHSKLELLTQFPASNEEKKVFIYYILL